MGALDDLKTWSKRQAAPATLAIIATLVAGALLFWLTGMKDHENFMLNATSHQRPWTFLTYAWAQMPFSNGLDLIFFAFLMMWLFSFGASIERQMGSLRFAVFWLISVIIIGIFLWAGMNVIGKSKDVGDAYLAVSAVTMVWCAKNMTEVIMVYGVLPLSGKWLAVVDAAVSVLIYGFMMPLLGLFAVIPLGLAFAFGAGRLPGLGVERGRREQLNATRAQARYRQEYYDDVKKREIERDEKERLRKLFESSIEDPD